ncbi:molybdopterin guanine dinucleotide biosynthesis protein MoaE [Cellvibrio zantedeschiae]|uniref:Molybdopterin synthase catalytic subunit n=1 Tax=Cellvibrio zantedeschiae TaxID=1237077 RepID=A0ABQ3ATF1_9GAMM|nr:molybdopterin synthase catalytic subunit MoaE [Cellvibrio zantedeschiae]GGY65718.1 molybdopterin guanine dinucleotide biosynthesis protein MoaE [Cellvibrio zantedeschiae]
MISIQQQDFDVGEEYKALVADDTSAGAVVTFVGRVRDLNLARNVFGLHLEHYPGMTEKSLQDIVDEAQPRWKILRYKIIHRIGDLHLGDNIVFVGVTSAHREDAFSAANFLMDYLKTRAPFWKKELTEQGSVWVESQDKDAVAAKRWE